MVVKVIKGGVVDCDKCPLLRICPVAYYYEAKKCPLVRAIKKEDNNAK